MGLEQPPCIARTVPRRNTNEDVSANHACKLARNHQAECIPTREEETPRFAAPYSIESKLMAAQDPESTVKSPMPTRNRVTAPAVTSEAHPG